MVCRSKRLVRWDLQVLINWAAWESWTISRMRGFVAATIQPGTLTTRSTVVRLAVPERLTTQQFCCVVRMGGPMLSVRWMTISIKVWLSECLMHSVKNRINFFSAAPAPLGRFRTFSDDYIVEDLFFWTKFFHAVLCLLAWGVPVITFECLFVNIKYACSFVYLFLCLMPVLPNCWRVCLCDWVPVCSSDWVPF